MQVCGLQTLTGNRRASVEIMYLFICNPSLQVWAVLKEPSPASCAAHGSVSSYMLKVAIRSVKQAR